MLKQVTGRSAWADVSTNSTTMIYETHTDHTDHSESSVHLNMHVFVEETIVPGEKPSIHDKNMQNHHLDKPLYCSPLSHTVTYAITNFV